MTEGRSGSDRGADDRRDRGVHAAPPGATPEHVARDRVGDLDEELSFHLERDADRCALARRADRSALAAALTKAAAVRIERRAVAMALGGSRVQERVEEIMGEVGQARGRGSRTGTAIAVTLVCLVVATALAVPPVFAGGAETIRSSPAAVACDD